MPSLGGSRLSPASACACASSPPTSTWRHGGAGVGGGEVGPALRPTLAVPACRPIQHPRNDPPPSTSTHLLAQAQRHAQAQQRNAHAQLCGVLVQRAAAVALERERRQHRRRLAGLAQHGLCRLQLSQRLPGLARLVGRMRGWGATAGTLVERLGASL